MIDLLRMAGEMALTCAVLFVVVFGIVWAIFYYADWRERQR